jgi:hypothetical protein
MKNIILTLAITLLFFASCKNSLVPKTIVPQDHRQTISLVLEKHLIASENHALFTAGVEELWDTLSKSMHLNTSSCEKKQGLLHITKALKEQYALISDLFISRNKQEIQVSSDHKTAWFSEVLNYHFIQDGNAKNIKGIRFSGVMVKKGNNHWKIVQAQLSFPEQYAAILVKP